MVAMRWKRRGLVLLLLLVGCGDDETSGADGGGGTGGDAALVADAPRDQATADAAGRADTGAAEVVTPAADMAAGDLAAGAETGGAETGGAVEAGASDAAGVTYQDVKPIFAQKCVPCHVPGGAGAANHTMADSYDGAADPSALCTGGKKKGECALDLVMSGFMPLNRGCTGNPTQDAAKPLCLNAAEQQKLRDWITGGLRQ